MDKQQRPKFSPAVRARAVRMVVEHRGDHASQWAAIVSIEAKIGCTQRAEIRSEFNAAIRRRSLPPIQADFQKYGFAAPNNGAKSTA